MTTRRGDPVAALVAAHRDGRTVAVLLDYDGTLTPITEHPRLAVLPRGRRRLLAELAAVPRVALGVVSGRMLTELQELVALPGVYYAGTGGMKLDLLGRHVGHPAEAAYERLITRVAIALQPVTAKWRSAWIERKPVGITVHYRRVRLAERRGVLAAIDRDIRPFRAQLSVLRTHDAVELLPRAGWNKGSAVTRILRHIGAADVLALYAGDDANDLHAFDAVAALGGIRIGVGAHPPPGADHRIADPDALHRLLVRLYRGLSAPRGPRRSPSRARRTPKRRPR